MNYNTKTRKCATCEVDYPLTEDYFQKNGPRLRTSCKDCEKIKSREYYIKNKEKLKEQSRERNKRLKETKDKSKIKRVTNFLSKGNWLKVKGYEDYWINDSGSVYSQHSEKLIAQVEKDNGYIVVNLWEDNKGTQYYVHRLVTQHFGTGQENETVNHKDGNKRNNHVSNLEWMTYSDNNKHARETGLMKSEKNNPKTSMEVEQRCLEGRLIKTYPSFRQAERETGIAASEISIGIKRGWNYGGYQWFLKGQYQGGASD